MNYYFISDKNNAKRREHIANQCKKIGLEPRYFDAIMGKNISNLELHQSVVETNFFTPSEIGCALSHLSLYKQLIASSHQALIVFEDDVHFTDSLSLDILQELYRFVETHEGPCVLTLKASETYYTKVKFLNPFTIYSTPRFMDAYAYIINKEAAQNIIAAQTPLSFEIDVYRYYYYLNLCDLYSVYPSPTFVDDTIESTIKDRDTEEFELLRSKYRTANFNQLFSKLSLKNKILSIYRRIKKHQSKSTY
ncbi:glycosyltransferase family 25 protein [Veillonella caviae]|uniref:glycosyltransferase family 25 protein n=1 Tax=Veillonella caviae TaxID=248316 RepID=UPI0023F50FF5|nr:glycosyltransferase family 25 protein [Veillonella caviae]MCI6407033.1 glycosyltransferase family 25 protein [Veillonella caviae]